MALALTDIACVPYYTQLLRLWDAEHEVETGNQVVAMVRKYGLCPEIRDLVGCFSLELDGSDETKHILHELTRL